MDELTPNGKRGRRLLLVSTSIIVILALLRLIAIFGPPMVIWTIAKPTEQVWWGLPWAFELYVSKVAETTGLSPAAVRLGFSLSTLLSFMFVMVACLTAMRRARARLVLLWLCVLVAGYHLLIGSQAAISGHLGASLDELSWLVLYLPIVFILTRPSVRELFPVPAPSAVDLGSQVSTKA